MALTKRQAELYEILLANSSDSHVGLTHVELGVRMGITKVAIHGLLRGLEARGYVRRTPGHARSIQIISRDLCPHCHERINSEACRNAAANTITTYSLTPTPMRAA